MMYGSQIMLYTWNLHSAAGRLRRNKIRMKKNKKKYQLPVQTERAF